MASSFVKVSGWNWRRLTTYSCSDKSLETSGAEQFAKLILQTSNKALAAEKRERSSNLWRKNFYAWHVLHVCYMWDLFSTGRLPFVLHGIVHRFNPIYLLSIYYPYTSYILSIFYLCYIYTLYTTYKITTYTLSIFYLIYYLFTIYLSIYLSVYLSIYLPIYLRGAEAKQRAENINNQPQQTKPPEQRDTNPASPARALNSIAHQGREQRSPTAKAKPRIRRDCLSTAITK